MNFRVLTLKYLSWCPGVKSAARFVPDRDIPPTRMALFIILVGSVAISSYLTVQRTLVYFGIPSPTTVNVDNSKPRLIVVEDGLFLATEVEIGDGFETFSNRQVHLARISTEGHILDVNAILDLRGAFLGSMDLLITSDGKWHMAYHQYRTGGFYYLDNDLKYIHSDDGKNWEKPVVVFKGGSRSPHFQCVSLTEVDKGEIFLCYRQWDKEIENETVYYSKYTFQDGWEAQKETPFHWYGVSSFLDRDAIVSIVGVPYPEESYEEVDGGSYLSGRWSKTYLSKMTEEGGWTEATDICYGGGVRAQIFYSRIRDGYFIVTNGIRGEDWVQLSFSNDLESWDPPINFGNAQRPTFAELSNGDLVLVFERFFEPPPDVVTGKVWTELFISMSPDGLNWSTPRMVETITDEKELQSILSNRRSIASAFACIPVSALVIILLYKKPSLGLGRSHAESNSPESMP